MLTAHSELLLCKTDLSKPQMLYERSDVLGRFQPTWSWDGRFVVSAKLVVSGHTEAEMVIEVLEIATGRILAYPVEDMPFFFSWHPDNTRFIYLCSSDRLMAKYIDILPNLLAPDLPASEPPEDESILLHTGKTLYFSFCPIPGVDRILTNVIAARSSFVGFNSLASIPLGIQPTRGDALLPRLPPLSNAPPAFQTPGNNDGEENPNSRLSLGRFTAPFWTCCNTIVVSVIVSGSEDQVVAFDSPWNPNYDGKTILDHWRTDGVFGVQKLMESHSMESDLEQGQFTLPPAGPIIEIGTVGNMASFVVSPNGRYVACLSAKGLVVTELLYDSEPWDDAVQENGTFFSRFTPRRLTGAKQVFSHPEAGVCCNFAPNSSTMLILTRHHPNQSLFCWHTIDLGEKRRVSYKAFAHCAFLMRHYLPFYSQYTQSFQYFSPDSSQFTYPADNKIWIQKVAKGDEQVESPIQLCDGLFAAWKPR